MYHSDKAGSVCLDLSLMHAAFISFSFVMLLLLGFSIANRGAKYCFKNKVDSHFKQIVGKV